MDNETKERMKSLVPQAAERAIEDAVREITIDLELEGFGEIEILQFLTENITSIIDNSFIRRFFD